MLTGLDFSLQQTTRSTTIMKDFSHLLLQIENEGFEKDLLKSWTRELGKASFLLVFKTLRRASLIALLYVATLFLISNVAVAEELTSYNPTGGKDATVQYNTVQCDRTTGCRYLI